MNESVPVGVSVHLRRILGLAGGLFLVVIGVWLFVGDVLVLAHHRPQYGDGPFGVMVGPIFAVLGGYMLARNAAAYGWIKLPDRIPR